MSATEEKRAPAGPADDTPDPGRWRALSVTLTAGFLSLLDVSIVAVALPSMGEGLGASPAAIQWVVSGYALTFGLALVPAGRPGDAFGRRTMFLAALTGSWCAALPRERRRASACSSRPVSCRGSRPGRWLRRTRR